MSYGDNVLAQDALARYLREHRERLGDVTFQLAWIEGYIAALEQIDKGELPQTNLATNDAYAEGFAFALVDLGVDEL